VSVNRLRRWDSCDIMAFIVKLPGCLCLANFSVIFLTFQLEKGVEAEMASFENECTVDIDWASSDDVLQPAQFVEHWRLTLWDKAFRVYFDDKAEFKFTKGLDLLEFEEGPIAIKRVTYR
jgi:hypothetical protein